MIFSFMSQSRYDFSINMNFCEVKAENHTETLDSSSVYQFPFHKKENKSVKK